MLDTESKLSSWIFQSPQIAKNRRHRRQLSKQMLETSDQGNLIEILSVMILILLLYRFENLEKQKEAETAQRVAEEKQKRAAADQKLVEQQQAKESTKQPQPEEPTPSESEAPIPPPDPEENTEKTETSTTDEQSEQFVGAVDISSILRQRKASSSSKNDDDDDDEWADNKGTSGE